MFSEAEHVANVAYLSVLLSVMAHGVTAFPLARAYGTLMVKAGEIAKLCRKHDASATP